MAFIQAMFEVNFKVLACLEALTMIGYQLWLPVRASLLLKCCTFHSVFLGLAAEEGEVDFK